jgi:dihydroorotase
MAALVVSPGGFAADPPAACELVLANGRVMDPQSGLDGVRHVGISGGRIVAVSEAPLTGRETIDVSGLVVAPGFIDLHSHAQDPASSLYQAHDGVTTALELELGVFPVGEWYREQAGRRPIHYGATVSHTSAHAAAILGMDLVASSTDPLAAGGITRETAREVANTTLTEAQIGTLRAALKRGLDEGALGIGMAIQYLPGVDTREVFRTFQTAAANRVPMFVHARNAGFLHPDSIDSLQELLADAAATGAPLHVVHIGSSGLAQAPLMIEMIDAARSRGLDVTTEVYPYGGGMAVYGSPLLTGPWRERFGIDYDDLQSVKTGERLTRETFERGVAETPEDPIVVHLTPEDTVDYAVAHPTVMIASDAVEVGPGRGHPRTAGTYSRVLGRYVRERQALTLMQALAKMTIMPARRLEASTPQMARKGRIRIGADADITIFDPERIIDRATYEEPMQFADGIVHVLVGGTFVVRAGTTVESVFPGEPIRRDPPLAAAPEAPEERADAVGTAPPTPAEVEAFADATMAELLQSALAPGAIVTIVHRDRLLLAKGYGYADVASGKVPDPQATLFHIGSVGKLMNAAIALRLEERGVLDIDADVNRYLKAVHVPEVGGAPLTARLLMTHRGGFETEAYHLVMPLARGSDMTPEEMQREIIRIRPPEAKSIYDNVGFGVLGQVVGDASDSSFPEALRREIFEPLGMSRSVAGLPLDRVADAATGYMPDADGLAAPIGHVTGLRIGQGAGDIRVTAVDIGRFLSALLLPGRLLQPATHARMMDFDTERFHPRLPGLGFAMMQLEYADRPAAGHRGQIDGFISKLVLFPQSGLGVFVGVNATHAPVPAPRLSDLLSAPRERPGGPVRMPPDPEIDTFMERFAEAFVPQSEPPPSTLTVDRELPAPALAGVYALPDASRYLLARMQASWDTVSARAEGGDRLWTDRCAPFVRQAPMYYECATPEGPVGVAFQTDGERVWVGFGILGAMERIPWWRTARFALLPLPVLVLIGLAGAARAPFETELRLRRILLIAGASTAAFLAALLLELEFAYPLTHSSAAALPIAWRIAFPLSALGWALCALRGGALLADSGAARPLGAGGRAFLLALVVAALGLIWLSWVWELLWPFQPR